MLVAKDTGLSQVALALSGCAVFDGLIHHGHELRPFRGAGIESAGFNQAFQHALVHFVEVDAAAEVEE